MGGREKKNMNRNEQSGEKKKGGKGFRREGPGGELVGRVAWTICCGVVFFSFFNGAPPSRPTLSEPAVALKKKKVRAYYRRDVEIM